MKDCQYNGLRNSWAGPIYQTLRMRPAWTQKWKY